jgi:hypothetical protein
MMTGPPTNGEAPPAHRITYALVLEGGGEPNRLPDLER